ncbi:MAG: hypothetical protein IPK72_17530 [Candidatus Eisenbacteria bacterium]|nr:hypothetical protein [Candidatus Eisenbacteria bacterium]
MRCRRFLARFTGLLLLVTGLLVSTEVPRAADVKNSSDHPLFPNRMPGYSISNYQQQGFASYGFRTKPVHTVEGKYTKIHYYLQDTSQNPGGLAIRRNYENAIKVVGGEVLYSDDNVSVMKAVRRDRSLGRGAGLDQGDRANLLSTCRRADGHGAGHHWRMRWPQRSPKMVSSRSMCTSTRGSPKSCPSRNRSSPRWRRC